jgi:hypothetical protein
MKQVFNPIPIAIIFCVIIYSTACVKDTKKSPFITLAKATDAIPNTIKTINYLNNDTILYLGINGGIADTLTVFVTCEKSEPKDKLDRFSVAQSFDEDIKKHIRKTTYVEYLGAEKQDKYTYSQIIVPRNQVGIEIYYFTIFDKDGVMNYDSVRVTVEP